jgi:polysaccharide export outer membrane protein
MLVAGCGSLPSAGPLTSDIRGEYKSGDVRPFELVDVSAATVETLKQRPDPSLSASFGDYRPPANLTIGIGDGVALTIWEAGGDGLFASAPMIASASGVVSSGARGSGIPEQFVGEDGSVTVPFAGRVAIAGKTVTEAQIEIERALSGKANKPQVMVHLRNASNTVTVVGELTGGARVPLSIRGDRLLDVLAAAGGIRAPVHEAQVQLTRGDSTVAVPLQKVLRESRENIYLQPGDDLIVTRQPQTFTAFGATGRNAQITFESPRLTLVEAIARAGGLLDLRADPRGVFLFRFEPQELARSLGGHEPSTTAETKDMPVVYRLDFAQAGSYFLARNFQMRDGDMLYVSSAPANELQKFLQLIGLITQPVIQGAIAAEAVKD